MTIDLTASQPRRLTVALQRLTVAEERLAALAPGYLDRVRLAASRLAVRDTERTDAGAALVAVDELAVIDLDVPTTSRIRGAGLLKVAVKRLVGWYLQYLAVQLSGFGQAVSNLGALLLSKTERLEGAISDLEAQVTVLSERVASLEPGGLERGGLERGGSDPG